MTSYARRDAESPPQDASRMPRGALVLDREAVLEDLRSAFGELLGAERRLRGRDQHRKGGGELSHHQIRALFHLAKEPEVTAGCLARNAELSPASMTAMLDQLEEWGYVSRRRSAEDRRQVLVSLTDQGREKMQAKRAMWNETLRAALDRHSDEELETAVRVMRTMGAFLDTLGRD
jgi:MarR family transcriptional regulator, organic hydroperoxide resistance regulator